MKKVATMILVFLLLFTSSSICVASQESKMILNVPSFTLIYYDGNTLIKTYHVAVGRSTQQTPRGDFKVSNKQINPTWFPRGRSPIPPGPANPLGTRWLGLRDGYGIHGNNNPAAIGTLASAGCIRLYNDDVEELYEKVKIGTPVKITYDTFIVNHIPGPYMVVYPDVYYQGVNKRDFIVAKLMENRIDMPESKLFALLSQVNKKIVVFSKGYVLTFNGEVVTNDVKKIEQDYYINRHNLEDFIGVKISASGKIIDDAEYVLFSDVFGTGDFSIILKEDEELIEVKGNMITLNGAVLPTGFIREQTRTLIPVRSLAEFYNLTLFWDSDARTVFLDNTSLKTVLIKGRSYIPIDEAGFLFNLVWSKDNKKSIINFREKV